AVPPGSEQPGRPSVGAAAAVARGRRAPLRATADIDDHLVTDGEPAASGHLGVLVVGDAGLKRHDGDLLAGGLVDARTRAPPGAGAGAPAETPPAGAIAAGGTAGVRHGHAAAARAPAPGAAVGP